MGEERFRLHGVAVRQRVASAGDVAAGAVGNFGVFLGGQWRLRPYAYVANGTVSSFGWNQYGQLGDSSITSRNVPVPVSGLDDVTMIAAGVFHSLSLKCKNVLLF